MTPSRLPWAAAAALTLLALSGPTRSLAAPDATDDMKARRDTFVSSDNPNTNYGGNNSLFVGQRSGYGATRTLVWFDAIGDLDKREAIEGADLRLYLRGAGPTGDTGRDIVVFQVTGGWDEGGATWASFPGTDGDRLDTTNIATGTGWYSWDVGDLVRAWRWPAWHKKEHAENHGLFVQGYEADGSFRQFDSREGSNAPVLRIRHTTDRTPPKTAVDALPLYHNLPDGGGAGTSKISLKWSGTDPVPATGIDFFNVYVQRNDEAWTLYKGNLRQTTETFVGENGRRYAFAVYAVDVAGNSEAVKPADTQTLVDQSPPLTTVTALPPFERGPFTVTWGGADQPVGTGLFASGISTYDVDYNIAGGAWAPLVHGTTATSIPFTPQQGLVYQFRVNAIDLAGNVEPIGAAEAQTHVDGLAPIVRFTPIAGIDRTAFTVTWQGIDPGGSGVVTYDIQVRRDLGPWEDLVVGTAQTASAFQGEFSHVYGFRGRARDAAGNLSLYPGEPQINVGVIDRQLLTTRLFLPSSHQVALPPLHE